MFLDVHGKGWFCLLRKASISRFLFVTQVMSGVSCGMSYSFVCEVVLVFLLGFPRYGMCNDVLCSDQDLCMTVLGLFAFCSGIHEFVEQRLCPLNVAAPSATGA